MLTDQALGCLRGRPQPSLSENLLVRPSYSNCCQTSSKPALVAGGGYD
jgi:hypothetical protein